MPISRRDILVGSTAVISALSLPSIGQFADANSDSKFGRWQLPEKTSVRVINSEWIPMTDGRRLSARLWLPVNASKRPVPVVLEYIPYRKDDFYRAHDDLWGQTLAQYGVAYARVDVGGSGDSDGVLVDEYLDRELNDGVQIIGWLARQPWSNGSVGMRGISWGGINTLQVAALAPPELKAIMPMCCTDTRYTDDAHYIGGALGLTDLQWGVQFKAVMAMPPDPSIVGDDWRNEWQKRLNASPAILEKWLSHQRNDAYWRRGSVSTDYRSIKCPIYIVDGWTDTYVNTVTRILANVSVPRKALFGPWAHNYPESANPGPSLVWAYEEIRWWKQWLDGVDTGIMNEPMLRSYMPYRTVSEVYPADIPGRWVAESSWPSPHIKQRTWFLDEGRLSPAIGARSTVHYTGDQIVGMKKPEWLPFPPEGIPGEQTADDDKSLVFDSAPLDTNVEILGHPVAHIRVAADKPVAKLALRLCEVTPSGHSWLVTYGLLNLTQRDSNEHPSALTPGTFYDVKIDLSLIAHRFKAGNRIRLAVSESLWPLVWPSPEVATLSLVHGDSRLELPVRPMVPDPPFPIPISHDKQNAAPALTRLTPLQESGPDANGVYMVRQDPSPFSFVIAETNTTVTGLMGLNERLSVTRGDNNSCIWEGNRTGGFKRGDWDCSVYSSFRLTSTPQSFFIEETVRAFEGDVVFFERTNQATIKRDLI